MVQGLAARRRAQPTCHDAQPPPQDEFREGALALVDLGDDNAPAGTLRGDDPPCDEGQRKELPLTKRVVLADQGS